MDRSGQVWTGADRCGQERTGVDRSGQVWAGEDRCGQERTGVGRSGQVWAGEDLSGLMTDEEAKRSAEALSTSNTGGAKRTIHRSCADKLDSLQSSMEQ